MTMDDDKLERLKEMMKNGEIDQDLYDEIVRRWENDTGKPNGKKEDKEKKEDKRERSPRIRVVGVGRFTDIYTHEFKASGAVKVEGYVDADSIDISGATEVGGDIKCSGSADISGSVKVNGHLEADELETSGSMKVDSVNCRNLDSSGSLKVSGKVTAENMDVSGNVAAETVEANVLKTSGRLDTESIKGDEVFISGKVTAKDVECKRFEMEIQGSSSRIRSLKADAVEVRQNRRKFFSGSAEIDEIECSRAQLEGVVSKSVKGDELIIGDDCDIQYAEGKSIKVSEKARVREKKIL